MSVAFFKHLPFTRALQSRSFALVWIGQTISGLGDGIFYVALAWQILLLTDSATAMGLVLFVGMVPRLIFALIGGVTADRLPRRQILLWSDGVRAVITLLIAILGSLHMLQFWHLVIESLIFGVVDGFFIPAINAITPNLVEKDSLSSANALTSLGQNITRLLGPVLGASLVALASPAGAFAANGLSFLISTGFLLAVRMPTYSPGISEEAIGHQPDELQPSQTKGEKYRGIQGYLANISEGMVYVKSLRWIWVTILVSSVGNIGFIASLSVAMPRLVHDVYGQGVWLLSLIGATSALGSIIGAIVAGTATRLQRRGLLAHLSIVITSIGTIIFGLPFPGIEAPIIVPLASIMVGFGLAFFDTIWFTVLQEMIPGDKLGRVISIDMLGSFAMIPAADALGGIAADHIGPALIFIIGGLLNIVIIIPALLVREIRELK